MIDGDYKFFESYDDALDARKHEEYWNKGIEHAAPRPVYAAPPAAVNQQLLEALKACEQCLTFIHGGEPLRTDIPLQLARAAIAAGKETGK